MFFIKGTCFSKREHIFQRLVILFDTMIIIVSTLITANGIMIVIIIILRGKKINVDG